MRSVHAFTVASTYKFVTLEQTGGWLRCSQAPDRSSIERDCRNARNTIGDATGSGKELMEFGILSTDSGPNSPLTGMSRITLFVDLALSIVLESVTGQGTTRVEAKAKKLKFLV